MGLDTTHDAFSGAYSAFNRFRQKVAQAMGGSFPTHYVYGPDGQPIPKGDFGLLVDETKKPDRFYWGAGYGAETHPGLNAFFLSNDCEGEFPPDLCTKMADEMEALLPAIERLDTPDGGHIGRDGGYVAVTRRFIAGCRAAAEAGEALEFH